MARTNGCHRAEENMNRHDFTLDAYRILYSVLLSTAVSAIWHILMFQVDVHRQQVKGIKSYLQSIEGAKI